MNTDTPETDQKAKEPSEIWLQFHGDSDDSENGPVSVEDVTWSESKVFNRDIHFVRAKQFEEARANLKLAVEALEDLVAHSLIRDLAAQNGSVFRVWGKAQDAIKAGKEGA